MSVDNTCSWILPGLMWHTLLIFYFTTSFGPCAYISGGNLFLNMQSVVIMWTSSTSPGMCVSVLRVFIAKSHVLGTLWFKLVGERKVYPKTHTAPHAWFSGSNSMILVNVWKKRKKIYLVPVQSPRLR